MQIHRIPARSYHLIGVAALALALTAVTRAAAPPPPDGVWTGKGQGGLLISSGNSDATSINAKLDLAETSGPWKNIVYVGGLYGKNSGVTSGERFEGRYELDHMISDRLFGFASLGAVKDLFSGFNYQATATGGLDYKFIDTPDTKLTGLLGLGYQRLQTQTLTKNAAGVATQRVNGLAQGALVGTAGLWSAVDAGLANNLVKLGRRLTRQASSAVEGAFLAKSNRLA
jgi:putative salt-induced outer membrane protein YdiY